LEVSGTGRSDLKSVRPFLNCIDNLESATLLTKYAVSKEDIEFSGTRENIFPEVFSLNCALLFPK